MRPITPVREPFRFEASPRRVSKSATVFLRTQPDRLPLALVGASLALLPVLNPKGPLNSAPVDLLMGAAILMVAIWAGTVRARVHIPYAVAAGALMVAGLVAALAGQAPITGLKAVVQEIFLLAWCAAVASLCRTPRALQSVVRTWCFSATAWAVIVMAAVITGQGRVPGGSGGTGQRARLWFDHPNMAGNYFIVAFFMVLATRQPRQPLARAVVVAALLIAILLTGSNAALSLVPLGGLIIVFLRIRSRDPVAALAVSLCLVIGGGVVWTVVAEPVIATIQDTDTAILRHSIGRGERSANARASLFESQYEVFQEGDNYLGIGPSATAQTLGERRAAVPKTSHNDYLATLVERGPLGVVALLALMGAVGVRVISAQKLPPEWATVVPNPAALAAATVGFAATAITHEVLHFRQLWTLLAVLGALHLAGRAGASPPPAHARPSRPPGAIRTDSSTDVPTDRVLGGRT